MQPRLIGDWRPWAIAFVTWITGSLFVGVFLNPFAEFIRGAVFAKIGQIGTLIQDSIYKTAVENPADKSAILTLFWVLNFALYFVMIMGTAALLIHRRAVKIRNDIDNINSPPRWTGSARRKVAGLLVWNTRALIASIAVLGIVQVISTIWTITQTTAAMEARREATMAMDAVAPGISEAERLRLRADWSRVDTAVEYQQLMTRIRARARETGQELPKP